MGYNVFMRLLIQECLRGSVTVDGEVVSRIGRGEVVFVGFTIGDNEKIIDKMIDKLLKLRIFADKEGKTNLPFSEIDGEMLLVSQFTLYADLTGGNRPSFVKALPSKESQPLFEKFLVKMEERLPGRCHKGIFGADMKVELVNDGPFTILLDSKELWG